MNQLQHSHDRRVILLLSVNLYISQFFLYLIAGFRAPDKSEAETRCSIPKGHAQIIAFHINKSHLGDANLLFWIKEKKTLRLGCSDSRIHYSEMRS